MRSLRISTHRDITFARSSGGVFRHSPSRWARNAEATARSASSALPNATVATNSSDAGLITSVLTAESTQSPSMYIS